MSFGYHLNPRYAIKECLSCGALYTEDFCCSKGKVEDKILVSKLSKNCARCGHPVDGPYYQGCALLRKKLKEDLVTYFQYFQNTSESSDDSTNVVNAPRDPFVVKQDHESFVDKIICDLNKAPDSPHLHTFLLNQLQCFHCKDVLGDGENSLNDSPSISENSSQSPPHINHHCCYECGDVLDGIFCQRCTCKSCGKGAHIGYNCPPKVLIISNPEPCNQTMNNEPPQTLPSFDPTCYSEKENSLACVSKPNFVDESPNVFNPPPQPPIYSCEFCGSNAQYGHYCTSQVSFIYPEPGYNQDFNFLQNFHDFQQQYLCCDQCGGPYETFQSQQNRPAFYDDDDVDYTIAITPVLSIEEPDNSLSMRDEHLNTIPAMESDEVIKSSVEDLVPIPSESEALKDNPTPSSEFLIKPSSTSPKSFLEETNTFDNSLPKFENFCFDLEEISSGSTTTHSDIPLSEYDSFIFDLSNDQFPPTDMSDFTHEEFADELAHIISPLEYDCF
nr:hypothetical protein [Tanacetum cinerariifolium]